MARMLLTRREDRALQRCNLSAVPGAKTEGGRSLTAHLPCNSIKQPSDLALCEKTFVARCHDCDLTGCLHAQHIRVRRAAKPRLLASGVRAKPALRVCRVACRIEGVIRTGSVASNYFLSGTSSRQQPRSRIRVPLAFEQFKSSWSR